MAQLKTDYQVLVIGKVKKLRTENSVSQQQLATILGVTNGQIGNIESLNYPHKYTLRQLTKIAKHFGESIDFFFLDEENSLSTEECVNRICEYLEGEK